MSNLAWMYRVLADLTNTELAVFGPYFKHLKSCILPPRSKRGGSYALRRTKAKNSAVAIRT